MEPIILLGFMGVGKSTIGKKLAQQLKIPFIDLDSELEKEVGMDLSIYFSNVGEETFRKLETKVLKQNLSKTAVIATGGGVVMKEENRTLLKSVANVFYLTAQPKILLQRIANDIENIRPIAQQKSDAELSTLIQFRQPLYESCANYIIETTEKNTSEITTEILTKVGK